MAQSKTELLSALKNSYAQLQKLQGKNKEVLRYLPKEFVESIKLGKVLLQKGGDYTNPEFYINNWFNLILIVVSNEEKVLALGRLQKFNFKIASKYAASKLKSAKLKDIIDYVFGRICNEIAKGDINFSKDQDVTKTIQNLKDEIVNTIVDCINKEEGGKVNYKQIPATDFLAEKLLMLYIESSSDSMFDITKGEFSKIRAGHVYFKITAYFERKTNITEKGTFDDYLELVHFEDSGKPMMYYSDPFIDDISGDKGVIYLLKKLYGENTRIIDLPIKIKVAATINVSEAVGSGSGSGIVGGSNGFYTIVVERQIGKKWKIVSSVDNNALENKDLDDFMNNKLLNTYTINNLVPE